MRTATLPSENPVMRPAESADSRAGCLVGVVEIR